MSKSLKAFNKICKNLNSYEFTDEYKKNKKLIIDTLKDKKKKDKFVEIVRKTISTDLHFDYEEDTERWYVWIDCEGCQVYIFEGQGKEQYDLLKEVLVCH